MAMDKIQAFKEMTDKAIKEKKLSHAYLIEIKSDDDKKEVDNFIKKILTETVDNEEEKTKIEKLIEKNTYFDYKTIAADGSWIKKEQILEVQSEFSNKSMYGNKRVYVIEEAEKLNKSSANTLLKFLEEPEKDIIGILITRNKHMVLETLISRCQYFNIASKIDNPKDKEYIDELISFIEMMEEKKENSIAYYSLYNQERMLDRIKLKEFLSDILQFYNDILYIKTNLEPRKYKESIEKLTLIADLNDKKSLIRKINALNYCIEQLKYNVNLKMLLDKLNILMSGSEINV